MIGRMKGIKAIQVNAVAIEPLGKYVSDVNVMCYDYDYMTVKPIC